MYIYTPHILLYHIYHTYNNIPCFTRCFYICVWYNNNYCPGTHQKICNVKINNKNLRNANYAVHDKSLQTW